MKLKPGEQRAVNWDEAAKEVMISGSPARVRLLVNGRVQGVGFRPTVYRYAVENGLSGFVMNTRAGVAIEVEGSAEEIEAFGRVLTGSPPPLSVIESLDISTAEPDGGKGFCILPSEEEGESDTLYPVDTAVCEDCLSEMLDPGDPRYRYPFINCTNCGPRFTIIEGLPYDRPLTTMRDFEMDAFCRSEYTDPLNRRFHAEPVSCPACGPGLELLSGDGEAVETRDPVKDAVSLLKAGNILAVKGLGGYHLSCMATDPKAVAKLRRRKKRPAKPFAVMFRDIDAVEKYCLAGEVERELLLSPRRPIVLLRKGPAELPGEVAPANGYIGAFLPYTPVHHLLLEDIEVLVMTSANFTDEPLISDEEELDSIMGDIADFALASDRRIAHKCDDSIFFAPSSFPVPLRRARGYVPEPIVIAGGPDAGMLALGGHKKGTFALSRGDRVFLSPHLGDLGDIRSQDNYRRELDDFINMFNIEPRVAVCDMHPDYFTTRLAAELPVEKTIRVQHHHAHAASVMAEYGLEGPVLAVAFDGTGYGGDGTLWGGEFLLAGYGGFNRIAHIKNLPLPGGEKAIEEPWRMALMHLRNLYGDGLLDEPDRHRGLFPEERARIIMEMAVKGINAVPTSSIGRLFDAVSFLLCGFERVSFEGEAPIALEALALESSGGGKAYGFEYDSDGGTVVIDPAPLMEAILKDLFGGVPRAEIAWSFHESVARMIIELLMRFSEEYDCREAVVSGGVFQNRLLCESLMDKAASIDIECYFHSKTPPNDGGISLGQLMIGMELAREGEGREKTGAEGV